MSGFCHYLFLEMEEKTMFTNKRACFLVLSVMYLVLTSKGQTSKQVMFQDTVSIPYLHVSNDYILPLIDSVDFYWENSPLKDRLSYATIVPQKIFNGDTIWRVQLEQLSDFDVFSFVFPGCEMDFASSFVLYGLLEHNNHEMFVGIEKNSMFGRGVNESRRIVEGYFLQDSSFAIFTRDVLEQEIYKSNYIAQCDTIISYYPPEIHIDKTYYSIELDYMEINKSFILMRKKVVGSPRQ